MGELGIDPPALSAKAKRIHKPALFQRLRPAVFFDKETFGTDRLVVDAPRGSGDDDDPGEGSSGSWEKFLAKTPLGPAARRDILRLQETPVDYLPGLSSPEKKDRLSRMSYRDFLLTIVKVDAAVVPFYQTRTHDLFGAGIDAVNALDCWALGLPGFQGMKLEPGATPRMGFTLRGAATPQEPYTFHFPDGNATVARLLVRSLIPGIAAGHTAEDIVTANFEYNKLDNTGSPVKIRLNSTVAQVRHLGDSESAKAVEVSYFRDHQTYRVRGNGVVLACWNMMIPYLCPELSPEQKEALRYGVKVPLVYTAVALRNSTAFHKLGMNGATAPGMYHTSMKLEMPTPIGDYRQLPKTPVDPVLVRMLRTPCKPGLPEREQHRAGHIDLF